MELLRIIWGAWGASICSKIAADEIKAWCPTIAERIVRSASQRLAPDQRERYTEEWNSDLAQVPGGVSKVIFALDLHRAALGINRHIRKLQIASRPAYKHPVPRILIFPVLLSCMVYGRFTKRPKITRPMDLLQLSDIMAIVARPWREPEIFAQMEDRWRKGNSLSN